MVTLIGTLIWSASSVINNSYEQDIVGIIALVLSGYAFTIVLLSLIEGRFPGDKRSHRKKASDLFKGFFAKGVELAFVVIIFLACMGALSAVIGFAYALYRGEDVFQAIVQFYRVFIWGAVGVSVLVVEGVLLNHWNHLLLFIEQGSNCNGYYHWLHDDELDPRSSGSRRPMGC